MTDFRIDSRLRDFILRLFRRRTSFQEAHPLLNRFSFAVPSAVLRPRRSAQPGPGDVPGPAFGPARRPPAPGRPHSVDRGAILDFAICKFFTYALTGLSAIFCFGRVAVPGSLLLTGSTWLIAIPKLGPLRPTAVNGAIRIRAGFRFK